MKGIIQYPDWVNCKKKEVHTALFAQIADYDKNVAQTVNQNSLKGMKQYTLKNIPSLHSYSYMGEGDTNSQLNASASQTRINFNLTAAVIDTLAAKLASIAAVPQVVTKKAKAKGRKLAEDLNFLLKGLFQKYDLSHMLNLAFKDAMINKAGYLKIVKDDGEVRVERVIVDEVIVDPADGYYGRPYKMIHRRAIPIHALKRKFPKIHALIDECQIQEIRQYNTQNYTPCVVVAEAWCKNSYVEGGRHVISIENYDILDEEWDKDYFPIVKCEYNEPVLGWLGQSVTDELEPIQLEIDRILVSMQAIMRNVSVPRVFIDTNTQVNKAHISNKIGLILEYDGSSGIAPIIHNGAAMPPELPAQLQFLISQGYARVGLTTMDTQGEAPRGLKSGEALDKLTEVKSERWQLLQHNYEQKHVELSNIILQELRGTSLKLKALDRDIGLKEVNTKVIPKTEDSYILQIFPVSSLPDAIPERIEAVRNLMALGVVQQAQVPDLFNMPDLDAFVALQSAPRKLIDKMIEKMEDEQKYTAPEPYHDLDYGMTAAVQHYSFGQLNDEDEKVLVLLRRFINDLKMLIAQRAPPPMPNTPPQPQAAPVAPQGVPQQ